MTISWITPLLGTSPALNLSQEAGINIIDVRDMVDKAGNHIDVVRQKIIEGYNSLREGKKTLICCDYGISRSNAVAAGVLAMYESISLEEAVRLVLKATGEKEIKVDPLQVVRKALGMKNEKLFHKKSRILITGGTGFIGKALNKRLAKDFEIFAPTSNEIDLEKGSIQLDLAVVENQIDCIIHLANPRVYTSNRALGNTLTMLRNVLDVCVMHDIKLVYLSCWEVYSGYRSSNLLADESLPLFPKGPYAETKYLCEMLIEHCRRTTALRCTILRASPVYGVYSERPKFIYNFIEKIKNSQHIVTHSYKNALPALDLLFIDDLVAAVMRIVNSGFSGNLNIGTGVATSTLRVAEILRELLDGQNEINTTLIDGDIACIAMDSRKIQDILGWRATVSVEQGLQSILSSLKAN